ncbi:DNA repair endonuclease XPF [Eupeodes corollae]|uniref:DNA repair endonuclease XPF n=1 Tax=Eupeodes corollae TaxID=290404 RepID=UPI002490C918|nr:DNA repair endonuclease XPF [Eupeodes corollae]
MDTEQQNETVEPEPEPEEPQTQTKIDTKPNEENDLANVLTAEEYLTQKNIVLLDYERQMFVDMVQSDGLVVCAKGLSYDKVITNIMNAYSDAGNLILVINSSDWEETYYKSKLDKKYVHEVANTAAERERVYLEGGIQFISTRILVVDLLKNRIPIELISGVFVMRAHSIVESCQEAFALRLYRQKNKTGFIKAFSSNPQAFTIGYSQIERTMRNLFVKELYIWPRFHALVRASLKRFEAQTVELHVPMSEKMITIQGHILDIMNYLVKEIKRINRTVDLDEITVENCVTKHFHKILQAQLDCIWHQLNSQTKLIVADLKVLRNLMISTIYNDSVSAYALIKRYRTTEYALSNSGWVLLDSAEHMFMTAKDRVYNDKGEFNPEPCPKWKILTEILKTEIPTDMKKTKPKNISPPKVLILCQDSRTCYQLRQMLTGGGERFLLYTAMRNDIPIGKLSKSYQKVQNIKIPEAKSSSFSTKKTQETPKNNQPPTQDVEEEENELTQLLKNDIHPDEEVFQESYMLTMTQQETDKLDLLVGGGDDSEEEVEEPTMDNSVFEPFPEMENLDITATVATNKQPLICIQTFKTERDGVMALDKILAEIEPHYVIMYHCNIAAIRQLEVYEARLRRPIVERLKVYFLIHAQTVEEQSYLTSLRREKQAFELIIDTKSKMVIPEYQDGKTDEAFVLLKHYKHVEEESNATTRKAGGQVDAILESPKIIVDMREFRSDLPCLIHKRGIEVLPVTIIIGDYILTPEICVERKSISDLIGSLNSGRLYNQCIQMQRHYTKPILLIEFDQNKPFHLQGKYMLSANTTTTNADIVKKLQLLTIHFPKLRLIWSPSPYATAQLFEELKLGKPEPDPKTAAAIGSEEAGGSVDVLDKFNSSIFDFMLRLPGINSRNIHTVMRNGGNLKQLLAKSQAELSELVESQANGKMLYDILHVAHLPQKDEQVTSGPGSSKPFQSKFGRGGRGRSSWKRV